MRRTRMEVSAVISVVRLVLQTFNPVKQTGSRVNNNNAIMELCREYYR